MTPTQTRVLSAVDALEISIHKAVNLSQDEENQAKRWIGRIGAIIAALALINVAAPFISGGERSVVLLGISGVTVQALLVLLYSPVNRLLKLSKARSALMTLPAAYRIRVISTTNDKELGRLAKEVFDRLQSTKID